MAAAPLVRRVEIVEEKMELLADLPRRVTAIELQIVQFREEVRGEFAALRGEMVTRGEMSTTVDLLRAEIRQGDEETRRLVRESEDETRRLIRESKDETLQLIQESKAETRQLIQESEDETRRYMRVPHEEVLSRFALLQESSDTRRRAPARRSKP